jgi:hypothetical protein
MRKTSIEDKMTDESEITEYIPGVNLTGEKSFSLKLELGNE